MVKMKFAFGYVEEMEIILQRSKDVYFGRKEDILAMRKESKQKTLQGRKEDNRK